MVKTHDSIAENDSIWFFHSDVEVADQLIFKQHNISTTQALAMSDWLLDVDTRVNEAIRVAKERGFCSTGDAVIVVTGWVNFLLTFHLKFVWKFLASRFRYDQHASYHLCWLKFVMSHWPKTNNRFSLFFFSLSIKIKTQFDTQTQLLSKSKWISKATIIIGWWWWIVTWISLLFSLFPPMKWDVLLCWVARWRSLIKHIWSFNSQLSLLIIGNCERSEKTHSFRSGYKYRWSDWFEKSFVFNIETCPRFIQFGSMNQFYLKTNKWNIFSLFNSTPMPVHSRQARIHRTFPMMMTSKYWNVISVIKNFPILLVSMFMKMKIDRSPVIYVQNRSIQTERNVRFIVESVENHLNVRQH